MLKVFGGLDIMLVGAGLSYATMQGEEADRLFFGLIGAGCIVMIKGNEQWV